MADLAGLFILAAVVVIAALVVPVSQVAVGIWVMVYAMAAVTSLFVWRHPKSPHAPKKWLLLAIYSLAAAPLFYGLAVIAARIFFLGNEPSGSKGFDIFLTLMIAPGLTIVSLIGAVRAVFLARKKGTI
jgi:hypothetical protein